MTEVLLLSLKLSIGALILAIGMAARVADIAYLWQRPGLLLRSLAAMYVLVPLTAFSIVEIMPLTQGAKFALLVLAVSSGAPLLPRKLGRFGGDPYILSLVVTSSLLAILIVPALITLLAWHFNVTTKLSMPDVAALIGKAVLLPLVIGMVLGALVPKVNGRIADGITAIASAVFVIASLGLIALHWRLFMEVRGSGMAALVILMLISIVIGHNLGGPRPEQRTALAIACCTRHVGVAAIVASNFPGPHTLVVLFAYIVCSSVVAVAYLQWQHRSMHVPDQVTIK